MTSSSTDPAVITYTSNYDITYRPLAYRPQLCHDLKTPVVVTYKSLAEITTLQCNPRYDIHLQGHCEGFQCALIILHSLRKAYKVGPKAQER